MGCRTPQDFAGAFVVAWKSVTLSNGPHIDSAAQRRLVITAFCMVGGGAFILAMVAAFVLGPYSFTVAAGLYVLAALIIPRRVAAFHPHPRFGLANTLTLLRLIAACLLAGFAAEAIAGTPVNDATAWVLFTLSAGALVLDGVDGYVARRLGLTSTFGARFDMEVDALLILVLSVMALALGKAGVWVLLSGLLRYGYVAAGAVWPVLTRPLPPALRRKVIAVIQGGTLAALLMPVMQPPASVIAAACALLLLTYSFGIDIVMQARA